MSRQHPLGHARIRQATLTHQARCQVHQAVKTICLSLGGPTRRVQAAKHRPRLRPRLRPRPPHCSHIKNALSQRCQDRRLREHATELASTRHDSESMATQAFQLLLLQQKLQETRKLTITTQTNTLSGSHAHEVEDLRRQVLKLKEEAMLLSCSFWRLSLLRLTWCCT